MEADGTVADLPDLDALLANSARTNAQVHGGSHRPLLEDLRRPLLPRERHPMHLPRRPTVHAPLWTLPQEL